MLGKLLTYGRHNDQCRLDDNPPINGGSASAVEAGASHVKRFACETGCAFERANYRRQNGQRFAKAHCVGDDAARGLVRRG